MHAYLVLLPGKYASAQEFIEKSGWFQPSLEAVLCRKASMHLPVFKSMSLAIYVFKHKFSDNKQYVGKSHSLFSGKFQYRGEKTKFGL